jgi:hypothetical protein
MIDSDGNFRIRSTGNVIGTNNYRAIDVTFRRKGFLDFLYFTDLENQTLDYFKSSFPYATRSTDSGGTPDGGPDLITWGADKCERHEWGTQAGGEGRLEYPTWTGEYWTGSAWSSVFTQTSAQICPEITFADADVVNGPFHSNDDIRVCGSPDFGRPGKGDTVEISGDKYIACGSGASPVFNPSLTYNARELGMPPSNTALGKVVQAAYDFTGPTTLQLSGSNVTVTNAGVNGGTPTTMAFPSNGLIRVKNDACSQPYDPNDTETTGPGCADVRVKGDYSSDLTIAAENDIIVTGNLTRSVGYANALLGLVANGYVRIWHPVQGSPCANAAGTPTNVILHAAILSLNGSFTVDNYSCGVPLGTLTVDGAIAQKHRGAVGTGGASITHGYAKAYSYNDQLKYRSPPQFLDPVQAAWRVLRQAEETPAR